MIKVYFYKEWSKSAILYINSTIHNSKEWICLWGEDIKNYWQSSQTSSQETSSLNRYSYHRIFWDKSKDRWRIKTRFQSNNRWHSNPFPFLWWRSIALKGIRTIMLEYNTIIIIKKSTYVSEKWHASKPFSTGNDLHQYTYNWSLFLSSTKASMTQHNIHISAKYLFLLFILINICHA